MIPAFIANEPSTETVQLRFVEPLTSDDKLLIELLAERYAGVDGTPFLTFSREGYTTLICPKAIRRIVPYVTDTFRAPETASLRIPPTPGS